MKCKNSKIQLLLQIFASILLAKHEIVVNQSKERKLEHNKINTNKSEVKEDNKDDSDKTPEIPVLKVSAFKKLIIPKGNTNKSKLRHLKKSKAYLI
jgi:hypothetical protein